MIDGVDLVTRFLFAWIGDWKIVQRLFCSKPRRMLYLISVLGIGAVMICELAPLGHFTQLCKKMFIYSHSLGDELQGFGRHVRCLRYVCRRDPGERAHGLILVLPK